MKKVRKNFKNDRNLNKLVGAFIKYRLCLPKKYVKVTLIACSSLLTLSTIFGLINTRSTVKQGGNYFMDWVVCLAPEFKICAF